jgi:hypothetical protein
VELFSQIIGMTLFPKTTGSANALFGAFIFFISGISSGLGALLKSTNQLPLMMAYVSIILVCLLVSLTKR